MSDKEKKNLCKITSNKIDSTGFVLSVLKEPFYCVKMANKIVLLSRSQRKSGGITQTDFRLLLKKCQYFILWSKDQSMKEISC